MMLREEKSVTPSDFINLEKMLKENRKLTPKQPLQPIPKTPQRKATRKKEKPKISPRY